MDKNLDAKTYSQICVFHIHVFDWKQVCHTRAVHSTSTVAHVRQHWSAQLCLKLVEDACEAWKSFFSPSFLRWPTLRWQYAESLAAFFFSGPLHPLRIFPDYDFGMKDYSCGKNESFLAVHVQHESTHYEFEDLECDATDSGFI